MEPGIAATALGDWAVARHAWASYGVALPAGEGPIELDFGLVPIRLNPAGGTEVVWGRRIDPARARLACIPLPESSHRFSDLVLHDGAARGHRMRNGRQVPVFDALMLLQASSFRTVVLRLRCPAPADVADLEQRIAAAGRVIEDWTQSIEVLCRQWSEGVPHQHVERPEPAWAVQRWGALPLLPDADPTDLLRAWTQAGAGREAGMDGANQSR